MDKINDRLISLIEYFHYSPSIFADEIGVVRSNISHIMSGRNKPGVDLVQKVLKRFPEISASWLLLGEGEMFTNVNYEKTIEKASELNHTKISDKLPLEIFIENATASRELTVDQVSKKEEINTPIADEKKVTSGTMGVPKRASIIKRITVYFNDNSFQDFSSEVG